jgi:hypothetical protein
MEEQARPQMLQTPPGSRPPTPPPRPDPPPSSHGGPGGPAPTPPLGPSSIGGSFSRHTPLGSPRYPHSGGGSPAPSSLPLGPPGGHGGGGPPGPPGQPPPGFPMAPPGFAMLPLAPEPKKKSHVQKPEDFTDTKQWDKFKWQSFVYMEENS